jgi:hypothetical protein
MQALFPDNIIREREDAAFYESLQFIQQECLNNSDVESDIDEMTVTVPKKKSAKKQPILEYTDKHGQRKELPPEMTGWYLCYMGCDLCRMNSQKAKKFCRRFCLPYEQYLEILEKVKAHLIFETQMGTSGRFQIKANPIELLLFGSLCYLG